jgi:hypothetical protein
VERSSDKAQEKKCLEFQQSDDFLSLSLAPEASKFPRWFFRVGLGRLEG